LLVFNFVIKEKLFQLFPMINTVSVIILEVLTSAYLLNKVFRVIGHLYSQCYSIIPILK
jgi:hypothetical protein